MIYKDIEIEELNIKPKDCDNKVSVFCITYNHCKYIQKTLDGIINQKTSFKFEVIVFDDKSIDGTTETIRDYATRYPDIIHAYLSKTNTYNSPYRQDLLKLIYQKSFSGKYVALCEGDDCWIDINKLQLQFDFLESHEDYSLVCHNFIFNNILTNDVYASSNIHEGQINIENVIEQTQTIATASMFMRSKYYLMDNEIFYRPGARDYMRKVYLAVKGKVFYIDRIMSIYNLGTEGSWSRKRYTNVNACLQDCIQQICFLKEFNNYTNCKYENVIMNHIQYYARIIMYDPIISSKKEAIRALKDLKIGYPCEKEVLLEVERLLNIENGKYLDNKWITNRKVIIWGTGVYAEKLTKDLYAIGGEISYYVIADDNSKPVFNGKKVFNLNKVNLGEDTIVLVGINRLELKDMIEILNRNGVNKYVFPFLFDVKSI